MRGSLRGVEAALGELDERQVGEDHPQQDQEEADRQRGESECVGDRRERQDGPDDRAGDRGDEHGNTWSAAHERDPPRANDEHHEGLRGEGLDEPSTAELGVTGVQDDEHDEEGHEVEDRADRSEDAHEPTDEGDVPCRWAGQDLAVDPIGGDRQLTDVVQQVVEQDLRRKHREEREEQRRPCRAEHVSEVRRRGHQHVLQGVGEDPPSLHHTVGQHTEVFVEQHDVGGVFGDVGSRFHGDADIGRVQRHRVVDTVAHVGHVDAGASGDLDDARLLVGADSSEHRGVGDCRGEGIVVETVHGDSGQDSLDAEADVVAHLRRDGSVVAGDDLDGNADPVEFGDRFAGVGLRSVDEGQVAAEVEVALVGQRGLGEPTRRPGGHGDDARSFAEQPLQRGVGLRCDVDTPLDECLGRAFGDQQWLACRRADHDRCQLTLVVERQEPKPLVLRGRVRARGDLTDLWRRPQGDVEGIAADWSAVGQRGLVAHQPEQERFGRRLAGRVEGAIEGDRSFGERSGFVSEEHLDVAEILDRDKSLHEHPLLGELA